MPSDLIWWTKAILAGWLSVAIYSNIDEIRRDIAPAATWLDVRAIHVYDSFEGEPPFISVDRAIRRPFLGEWTATVRIVSDGTNSAACIAEGRASYAVDERIPADATLDWWTHPAKCRLGAGRYRLDTIWRIWPAGYPEKMLFTQSNVFEVHPRPFVRADPDRPSPG